MAHTYHPDKNPDNDIVSSYFVEIQEAYAVLSSPLSKRIYDRERSRLGITNKSLLEISKKSLIEDLIKIENLLFKGPQYSVNKSLLSDYFLFLFSKTNLSILYNEKNTEADEFIIRKIIRISTAMPFEFLENLYPIFQFLIRENKDLLFLLSEHYSKSKQKNQFEKLFPLIVVILTILVCVAMYFYGKQ